MRSFSFSWRWLLVVALPLLAGFSACGITVDSGGGGSSSGSPVAVVTGGVFRSGDKGENWEARVLVDDSKKARVTIEGTNILSLIFFPADSRIMYAGTREHGAYRTLDAGEHWASFFTARGAVPFVAPHPKNAEVVYVAQGNRVLRTEDAGKTWTQIYLDGVANQAISALAVHPIWSQQVYLGTSDGRVIKSEDAGKTWTLLSNFKNRVYTIHLQKTNPNRVYVVLATNGLQRSEDGGQFWDDISEGLQRYPGGKNMHASVLVPGGENDFLILASDYGLIRSTDGGLSYEAIQLVTPPNTAPITSLAVNPHNGRELYYATANTWYRSLNGGEDWTVKRLPIANRAATALVVDFFNSQVLYLGAARLDK